MLWMTMIIKNNIQNWKICQTFGSAASIKSFTVLLQYSQHCYSVYTVKSFENLQKTYAGYTEMFCLICFLSWLRVEDGTLFEWDGHVWNLWLVSGWGKSHTNVRKTAPYTIISFALGIYSATAWLKKERNPGCGVIFRIPLLGQAENFTVYIRNFVKFPKFDFSR